MFVRRFMSDKAHRMLSRSRSYCGQTLKLGERLKSVTKLARCEKCEEMHERAESGQRLVARIDAEKDDEA